MIKWVVDECRCRAFLFKQSGLELVFDAIVKSDAVISSQIHQKLKALVVPLEENMDKGESFQSQKIVDPTRYPLAYGVTRVLHSEIIHLHGCLAASYSHYRSLAHTWAFSPPPMFLLSK